MERKHLEQALERNAFIIDGGDLFDACQGKEDKRRNMDVLRDEDRRADYFDGLVENAAKFYAPFARNIAVMTPGNHEGKAKKHYGTNLTKRLVAELNRQPGANIQAGCYTQFLRICLTRGTQRQRYVAWWTHGAGGAAPVTQGMISHQRRRVFVSGVDLMIGGHNHLSWRMDAIRLQLNHNGVVERKPVLVVNVPSYLDDYQAEDDYPHDKGGEPKPLGAYWLHMMMEGRGSEIEADVLRAW